MTENKLQLNGVVLNPTYSLNAAASVYCEDLEECAHRSAVSKCKVFCRLYRARLPARFCVSCERDGTWNIVVNSWGRGDVLTGLYACAGVLAENPGVEVNYYTRHPEWAGIAKGVNAKHISDLGGKAAFSLFTTSGYVGQLAAKADRKEYYCRPLGVSPTVPELVELVVDPKVYGVGDYIVLAPFASHKSREWPLGYWQYLEQLILENNSLHTVILDGSGDGKRHEGFMGYRLWGQSPQVVCNIVSNAVALVGNDSFPTHLGGLLGTPTVAIMAQLSRDAVFSYTDVVAPESPATCSGCFFSPRGGFKAGCSIACHGLGSITPVAVYETLKSKLEVHVNEPSVNAV